MKMNLVFSIAAGGVMLAVSMFTASAELRSYTSSDGKSIDAEVVGVVDGKASLKLKSGKTFDVPLTRLSESDQTFLKAWAKENVTYKLTDLRLDIKKVRKTERTAAEKKKKATKTSDVSWAGTLQNSTRGTIDDIKVSYTIYARNAYRSDTSSSASIDDTEGVIEVGSLEGGAVYDLETEKVKEFDKVTKGAKGERDTTERQTVIGVSFTVSIKDRDLITFEDPRGIAGRVADERKRDEEKEAREAERLER